MGIKVSAENGRLVFTAADGANVIESYTFDPAEMSADNRAYAVLHGMKQRLVDNAAIGRDKTTGKSVPLAVKMAEIRKIGDYYMSGAEGWNMPRTRGRGPGSESQLAIRAVADLQGVSVAVMTERIERLVEKHGGTRAAFVAKLAARPDVRARMDELRVIPDVVPLADDMLDELAGDGE